MGQDRSARHDYIKERTQRVYVQTLYLHQRRRYFWVEDVGEVGRVGGGVTLDNYGPVVEGGEAGRRKEAFARLKVQLKRVDIPRVVMGGDVHASRVALYLQTTGLHGYISELREGSYTGCDEGLADEYMRERVNGLGNEDMVDYVVMWLKEGMRQVDGAGQYLQRCLLAETE